MKIIIPFLNFSKTGGNRVIANLASEWKQKGHDVIFLAPMSNNPLYFPSKANVIWIDRRGKQIDNNNEYKPKIIRRGFFSVFQNIMSIIFALRRYGKDADVVLIENNLTAFPICMSRISAVKIFYIQAYEPDFYEYKKTIKAKIQKLICKVSYSFPYEKIVNAEKFCHYKMLRSSRVIPPGLDYAIYYPDVQKIKNETSPLIIGCIGRREAHKGTNKTIEVFNYLLSRNLNVKFKIAFGNLPRDCALDPKTYEIVMPKNDNELADFYRSLDVLIVTIIGHEDEYHYPIMESMACGVAVVSINRYCPATTENTWITNDADPKKIFDVICKIINSPDESIQKIKNGLEDVRGYSWDVLSTRMMEMFLEIIKEKSNRN